LNQVKHLMDSKKSLKSEDLQENLYVI